MMKENRLRRLLEEGRPSVSTRMWGTWPVFTESVGATGNFDYVEFVAEYAPFNQADMENIARAAELYDMGSMIKVDLQNRAYVAQKAVASGFQAVNFADHRTAEEVRQTIEFMHPMVNGSGLYGCPNRRFISTPNGATQLQHIERLNQLVLCFMIEKQEAVDNVEEICAVPGVDMVQFGPADYCMSLGWNRGDHVKEFKAAERKMIEAALRHGVQPRCEINSPEDAQYYIDLGVRHFSLGDQMAKLREFWMNDGKAMREIADQL
jgi:2,4-dihydroxyhept-2-ene-1,7-dioic acid aldolase